MADYFTKTSFAFFASPSDAAFLQAVLDVIAVIGDDRSPSTALFDLFEDYGDRFRTAFPERPVAGQREDCLSGLVTLFDDEDNPALGLDALRTDYRACGDIILYLSGDQVECDVLAEILRRCCPETLAEAPIAFEVCYDCSKAQVDAYGGATYVIFPDRVVSCGTYRLIDLILANPDRFAGVRRAPGLFRRCLDRLYCLLTAHPR